MATSFPDEYIRFVDFVPWIGTQWDNTTEDVKGGEKEMQDIKVGEKYFIKPRSEYKCGVYTNHDDASYIIPDSVLGAAFSYNIYNVRGEIVSGCSCCFKAEDLILSTAKKDMYIQELTATQEAALDADTQVLVKTGVLSKELLLSDTSAFVEWLLLQNKAEFAAHMATKLAEYEAKKTK